MKLRHHLRMPCGLPSLPERSIFEVEIAASVSEPRDSTVHVYVLRCTVSEPAPGPSFPNHHSPENHRSTRANLSLYRSEVCAMRALEHAVRKNTLVDL